MKTFDIPVALIFFNRPHYLKQQLQIIKKVKPSKLYLISDGARKDRPNEGQLVEESRRLVEESIDWECEVKKNYAQENMGCYDRIANGASWVFSQEEYGIFLEDDNIPELTFFEYCRENLLKYKDHEKIYWICGGNYLVDYENEHHDSYIFSQQMFPCGWASWRRAWKHYDGDMKDYEDKACRKEVLAKIKNKRIRNYKKIVWEKLYQEKKHHERYYTWDHQWHFTLLKDDAVGIVPKYNQITNIGVGLDSTHGGTELTEQLSGMVMLESKPLEFPLQEPEEIHVDKKFDALIDQRIKGVPTWLYNGSKIKKLITGGFHG